MSDPKRIDIKDLKARGAKRLFGGGQHDVLCDGTAHWQHNFDQRAAFSLGSCTCGVYVDEPDQATDELKTAEEYMAEMRHIVGIVDK